jgi:hypothetical protein
MEVVELVLGLELVLVLVLVLVLEPGLELLGVLVTEISLSLPQPVQALSIL